MPRDAEYVAGYRAGYHGEQAEATRPQRYHDGYTTGAAHRAADDWDRQLSAVEQAEDDRHQARIEWLERQRSGE